MTLLPTTETGAHIIVPPAKNGEQHPRKPAGQNFGDVINNMPRPAEERHRGETPQEQEKTAVDEPNSSSIPDGAPVLSSEAKPDIDRDLVAVEFTGQAEETPPDTPVPARPREATEYVLGSHPQLAPSDQTRSATGLPPPDIAATRRFNESNGQGRTASPPLPTSEEIAPRPGPGREIAGEVADVSINNSAVTHQPLSSPGIPLEIARRAATTQLGPPLPGQVSTEAGLRVASPSGIGTIIDPRPDGGPNPDSGAQIALSDSKRPADPLVRANPVQQNTTIDAVFKNSTGPARASTSPSAIERSHLEQMMDLPAIARDLANPKTERAQVRYSAVSDAAFSMQTRAQTPVPYPGAGTPVASPGVPIGTSTKFMAEDVSPFPDDKRDAYLNSLSIKDTLGLASSVSTSGPSVAAGTDVPRADIARSVGAQLAEQMVKRPQGGVDITLNPEELGRVRMGVNVGETTVSVSIVAERPETLDLIRRHVDQLIEEFRQLGYDGVEFQFSDHAETSDGSQDSPPPGTSLAGSDVSDDAIETPQNSSNRAGQQVGLDMRL